MRLFGGGREPAGWACWLAGLAQWALLLGGGWLALAMSGSS